MRKDQGLDEKFMNLAIQKARQGILKGQTPFGACLVRGNKVISCAHNVVWKTTDITAHAEINAIRQGCKKLKTIDLSGCVIYSTCEPCPMCFSALHWARITRIIYAATIRDAKQYGFNELIIHNKKMRSISGIAMEIRGGVLRKESIELFGLWSRQKRNRAY